MHGFECISCVRRIFHKLTKKCLDTRIARINALKIFTFFFIVVTLCLYNISIFVRIPSDGLSCFEHVIEDGIPDILDDLEHSPPKGKSVFFHETSCKKSGDWIIEIDSRQACAVESAANLNPNSAIYLLYTSPTRFPNVSLFSSSKYRVLQELLKYKNVHIRRVDLHRYTQNTPLQDWFRMGQLNRSSFVNSHTSDVLRYLSLWRYGGTYMDLDIVLMKSLENMKPNYAGAESFESVAAGILNFDHQNSGHQLAELCLKDLEKNFRGSDWGNNGPGVITRVLQNVCQTMKTYYMTEEKCKGFQVLPSSAFYPIHWKKWKMFFEPEMINQGRKLIEDSYAIHVWNKFSHETEIKTKESEVLYGSIAKKYCPNVYEASGDVF